MIPWLRMRLLRSTSSLRAQLIFGNVIALLLLLGGMGVICRYVTLTFMMQSVDRELERSIGMYMHPPPNGRGPGDRREEPPRGFGGPDGPAMHMEPGSRGPQGAPDDHGGPPPNFGSLVGGIASNPGPHGGGRRQFFGPDGDNPYRVHSFGPDGKSVMPEDTRAVWDADALAKALKGETVHSVVYIDGDPVRILSSPGFTPQGSRGAVQSAYPLKEVYRALSSVNTALLLLIPIGVFGAWWLGSALTNRILRRVQRMTQAAGHIGAQDFSQRLPVSGSDEFAELAQTFNDLLGRLDGAYQGQKRALESQRRFTADASHELKTPLTIVKGNTSLALARASTDDASRRTLLEIDTAAESMSCLVQDLLLLARLDEEQVNRNSVEILVSEILERAVAEARAPANQEGRAKITLGILPPDLSVSGDETDLVRLYRNLLDNALRCTPADGKISIVASTKDGHVNITVQDNGSGIAPEHLSHLGERFYRVDASRSRPDGGSGLGLSICRRILESHGGTMTIESSIGSGTTVRTTLPAA